MSDVRRAWGDPRAGSSLPGWDPQGGAARQRGLQTNQGGMLGFTHEVSGFPCSRKLSIQGSLQPPKPPARPPSRGGRLWATTVLSSALSLEPHRRWGRPLPSAPSAHGDTPHPALQPRSPSLQKPGSHLPPHALRTVHLVCSGS